MNTLIRHKVGQWLGIERQEDRYVQYHEHQKYATKIQHNNNHNHTAIYKRHTAYHKTSNKRWVHVHKRTSHRGSPPPRLGQSHYFSGKSYIYPAEANNQK